MVTIQSALEDAIKKLTASRTPLLDAQIILAHILNKDRLYILVNKDKILTEEEYTEYNKMIEKRLLGVPVQYIVKNQEFMGLDFYIDEGVLIPRPDTEILIEKVLSHIDENEEYTIIDIGTGSGAITVSLAKYINYSKIYSVDISDTAIGIAKRNAKTHDVLDKIEFLKGSLFDPLENRNIKGNIDIIVSNPPYIPTKNIENLQIEVSKHEPKIALDGGEDGLFFYRKIIEYSKEYLKKGGLIALEVGHDQAKSVADIIKNHKAYKNIETTKDLAGIERVVSAKKQF